MDENGLLYLLTASPPGKFTVKAKLTTQFNPFLDITTSELSANIIWVPFSGFLNGILVRINKATTSWFIQQSDASVVSPILIVVVNLCFASQHRGEDL